MKYPRLLADIKAAQSSIHLNYYIWTEDKFTLQVKEALIERAKAGVEVRCLYDQSGGMMSQKYLQDLKDNGVEIYPYLEFKKVGKLTTANYRSHRKIAVIDGKIGYVGGLNLTLSRLSRRPLIAGATPTCGWLARPPGPCKPTLLSVGSTPPGKK